MAKKSSRSRKVRDAELPMEQRAIPNEKMNCMTWSLWKRDLIALLGFLPKADGVTNEQHLFGELGVSREVAVKSFNSNELPSAFVHNNPHYRATPRTDPAKPVPTMYGAIDTHDHIGGWVGCRACQAEHVAARVGGLSWTDYVRDIIEALGAKPSAEDRVNLRRLVAMGVDVDDAKKYWVVNYTGRAYVGLRPQLKLPPNERKTPPRQVHLNNGDDVAFCGSDGPLTADSDESSCVACRKAATRVARPLIPDVRVETKLTTLEVAARIDYWHEAARTGTLDGEKIRDVGDLIHAIHQECEQWIEHLEDR